MNIVDSIKKLIEEGNSEDLELAALLLESDSLTLEEKKTYIEKFVSDNPEAFTENEKKILAIWLGQKENNNQSIQKLKLWILKNH